MSTYVDRENPQYNEWMLTHNTPKGIHTIIELIHTIIELIHTIIEFQW
jgi:hypothetical protein